MKSMELQETIKKLKAGDRLALSKFLTDIEISENPMELVLKLYNSVERTTPIIGITGFVLDQIFEILQLRFNYDS